MLEQPPDHEGVDNAADTEAGDHDAGDRCARLAFGTQELRHIGKHAEQEYAFEKDRAETIRRGEWFYAVSSCAAEAYFIGTFEKCESGLCR